MSEQDEQAMRGVRPASKARSLWNIPSMVVTAATLHTEISPAWDQAGGSTYRSVFSSRGRRRTRTSAIWVDEAEAASSLALTSASADQSIESLT